MISTFEYDSDFSELKEDSKLLALFVDVLNFVDRQNKIIKGSVKRLDCNINHAEFDVSFRLSLVDDVSWLVNVFLSQYDAMRKTDENLFLFDVKILPVGSSFDVTYKVYSSIPF